MNSFKTQLDIEEVAKNVSYKLNFLFQALLDMNHEGFIERKTVLGLAFIIKELQEEADKIKEFLGKFLK